MGITRKFMIIWNPCISSRIDAIAVPIAVKSKAVSAIIRKATGRNARLVGLNPAAIDIKNTIMP